MIKKKLRLNPLLATALGSPLLWLLTACLPAGAQDNWSFDVTPYLWVAGVEAETRLAAEPSGTPSNAARFDTKISAGFMMAAQVHYNSVGLFVDFDWLRLESDASNPSPAFSSGNLESDFIHSTMALTYKLPLQGKFHAELLAGARVWNISEELTYGSGSLPGFKVSGDKTWVDAIAGATLRYDLSEHWSLIALGNAGGAGSSFGYDVVAAVDWRFTKWCSAKLGYRYMHEDYSKEGFKLDADFNGFIVGVGFHF
jgi:opacity protein-like surface antigen